MTVAPQTAGAAPAPEQPGRGSGRRTGRVAAHLRVPLHRAGYSLIANAALTSALGLAFWAVAARTTSAAAVGATGALLAAMRLISHLADLGLRTGLVRFLPALRSRGRRVVLGSYALTGLVAALAAGVFVAVHGRWFEDLTLLDEPAGATLFVVASALWVVFVVQDSVLVALRRASWVPIENGAYGVVKLGLLVALVGTFPQWGIYLAWIAPLPVLVAVVAAIILGRELPALARAPAVERAELTDLARYSAGDYGGSLLWHSTLELMPLLVLALAGVTEAAYYTLAATIAMSLYLIPSAVGYAFVAEAAHDPTSAALNLRRAARQSIGLVAPAALAVVVAAPLILSILGPAYRDEATTLLRLLAASAIPQVATALAVNLHRARRDVGRVVRLYALVCVSVLGLGAVLVTRFGATGAGVAWLVAQCLVATVLLATTLREAWLGAVPTRLLRLLGAAPRRVRGAWHGAKAHRQAKRLLTRTAPRAGGAGLRCRVVQASADEAIVRVREHGRDVLVLKRTQTRATELARRREHHVLSRLHADPRIEGWRHLVPRSLPPTADADATWFAESFLDGVGGDRLVAAGRGDAVVDAGVDAISVLHGATAAAVVVDADRLGNWVDEPAAEIITRLPHLEAGLTGVAGQIRDAFSGRLVVTATCHGDLHPGNLILRPDARGVTGVVDWVAARDGRLPEVDVVNLAVAARADRDHEEMGALLGALADSGDPSLPRLLARLPSAPTNADLPWRGLLLLTWLDHVAMNLRDSAAYAGNRAWVARNVEAVLGPAGPPPAIPLETVEAGREEGREAPVEPAPPSARPAPAPATTTTTTGDEPAGRAVDDPPDGPEEPTLRTGSRAGRLLTVAGVVAVTLGPLLWWLGFERIDPRAIGATGPAADLPGFAFAGLGLVVVGFAVALSARRLREGWLAAHTAALVAMLYAVPVVVYGTARYSWAWKHVGIVDYISRYAAVDPNAELGNVYHNWPGFFAAAEVVAELAGVDPVTLARWAPVFFALALTAGVWFLLDALAEDRRVVWLGTWLTVLVNWVGQEYFSPQATAMVFYVLVLGLALRIDSDRPSRSTAVAVMAVVAMLAATASSHQLTPLMLTLSLAGLAVIGRRSAGTLALVAGVFTVAWAVWVAFAFVGTELPEELDAIGALFGNAGETLVDRQQVSAELAFVSAVGRGVLVVAFAASAVGAWRTWRAGRFSRAAAWLLVAPGCLVVLNDFGGEILLRTVLFASPLIGLFAAWGVLGAAPQGGRTARLAAGVSAAALSAVLLGGFLVAHFGKDGHYVFTPEEVAASEFIADRAPPGALLVEGSLSYPKQFRNYERVRYAPIDKESGEDRRRIAADPVGVMSAWMDDPGDRGAYLLITRSQKLEMEALGIGPPGLLQHIEDSLRASPRFEIAFANRDAVVFVPVEEAP